MGGEARPHPVPSPNRLKRGHWHIEGDGGYPEATTVEDAEVAAAFFFVQAYCTIFLNLLLRCPVE